MRVSGELSKAPPRLLLNNSAILWLYCFLDWMSWQYFRFLSSIKFFFNDYFENLQFFSWTDFYVDGLIFAYWLQVAFSDLQWYSEIGALQNNILQLIPLALLSLIWFINMPREIELLCFVIISHPWSQSVILQCWPI